MGKWRNKGEDEGASVVSEEVKKKAKAKAAENANIKPTTADESRQATAPEKAMLGEKALGGEDFGKKLYGGTMISNEDKMALEAKYRDMTSGKISPEDFNKALYGSGLSQEDKLALDQSKYQSSAGGSKPKGKQGKYGAPVIPKGENPDDYYTGKWRTGKKPTPAPAPEPPKPTPIRTGPMPIEDAPPPPDRWGPGGPEWFPKQPKFPDRGPIGGGPGQYPMPRPMPMPSWPPGGYPPRGGFPPYGGFPGGGYPGFPPGGYGGGMPSFPTLGPPGGGVQQFDPRMAYLFAQSQQMGPR